MMRFILIPFFSACLISIQVYSQTSISGVINNYAKVLAIDYCESKISVDNVDGFDLETPVILIQMKGAIIDESNSSTFGTITGIGSAGVYEKAIITEIIGNDIYLQNELIGNYEIEGLVQLVTIPSFQNVVVTETLTAEPWNGNTGGILAFEVEEDLTLNANIDVSGLGFRGGISESVLDNNCTWLFQQNDYYYSLNNWRGAPKGEGIAEFISGKEAGRGAQANGGGGGNDHNAGGGGGSNFSTGGQGGENFESSPFGCGGSNPGKGGMAVPLGGVDDLHRIFLGGGGGAGHSNNSVGSNGGNGGGICLIFANTFIGNSNSILANGEDALESGADGAGGGGGGGVIYFSVAQCSDAPLFSVDGGNGGNCDNSSSPDRCIGPGGGGGAGLVLSASASVCDLNLSINAGIAGMSIGSNFCDPSTNNASNGTLNENILFQIDFPAGSTPIVVPEILMQPNNQEICLGEDTQFSFSNTENANYQWQVNMGTGFQDIENNATYLGANSNTLSIQNPSVGFDGYTYHCVLTGDCFTDLLTEEVTLVISSSIAIISQPISQTVCINDVLEMQFELDGTNLNYQWQVDEGSGFVDLMDDDFYTNTQSANLTIAASSNFNNFQYQCLVMDDCGEIVSMAATLTVILEPQALFDFTIDDGTVVFNDLSMNVLSYLWNFGENNNTSIIENPTYTYTENGTYYIELQVENMCGTDTYLDSLEIDLSNLPVANFTLNNGTGCDPLLVEFMDESSPDISAWQWTFSGGNPAFSNEQNPSVTYETPGVYAVELEVTNSEGTNIVLMENLITVEASPSVGFDYEIGADGEVTFTNTSTMAANYEWNFGDDSANSTEENPIHTFTQDGVYNITLLALNMNCGSAITIPIEIGLVPIKEVEDYFSLSLFPNPTNTQLNLILNENLSDVEISIRNIEGKLLQAINYKNINKCQIDVSNLKNGLYLLQVFSKDQLLQKKFCVLKK